MMEFEDAAAGQIELIGTFNGLLLAMRPPSGSIALLANDTHVFARIVPEQEARVGTNCRAHATTNSRVRLNFLALYRRSLSSSLFYWKENEAAMYTIGLALSSSPPPPPLPPPSLPSPPAVSFMLSCFAAVSPVCSSVATAVVDEV